MAVAKKFERFCFDALGHINANVSGDRLATHGTLLRGGRGAGDASTQVSAGQESHLDVLGHADFARQVNCNDSKRNEHANRIHTASRR